MQNLWRRYGKKLLEVSCEFLLRLDHKYHANILCQCVLAVFPRRPRNEEDYWWWGGGARKKMRLTLD